MRPATRALAGALLGMAASAVASGCVLFGLSSDDYALDGATSGQGGSGGGTTTTTTVSGTGGDGGGMAAVCDDLTKNGAETDVDCGGTVCAPCEDGNDCAVAADCASRVCAEGACAAPACDDGVQNGGETLGIDCGGGCACETGQPCGGNADCASKSCAGGVCAAASCNDGILNGTESDEDCGGICPSRCAVGSACTTGTDCLESVCVGQICQTPSCTDFAANGAETDVDCGGTCPDDCAVDEGCGSGADCMTGVCGPADKCVPATCGDQVKNGGETATDCGGPCGATCSPGLACVTGADCLEAVCAGLVCQTPSCSDGKANGTETDADCGGAGCPACGDGDACALSTDCSSKVCTLAVCQMPTCSDAVENGTESDIDCGGAGCPGCKNGDACGGGGDCGSGACNASVCGPWVLRSNGPYAEYSQGQCLGVRTNGDIVLSGMGQLDNGATIGFSPLGVTGVAGFNTLSLRTSRGGTPTSLQALGAPANQTVYATATGPSGRYAIGGYYYSGALGMGTVSLPAPGSGKSDGFVVIFDATGAPTWGQRVPGTTLAAVMDIAFFANGDVAITGVESSAQSNIPGEPGFLGDVFVARLAAVDGAIIWKNTYVGSSTEGDTSRGIAVDPSGDVVVAGEYGSNAGGDLDFGSGAVLPAGSTRQGFIAKLDGPSGATVWARAATSPGATGQTVFYDVATDALGAVVGVGAARGSVTMTGGTTAPITGQEYDVLIARLDAAGTPTHTKILPGTGGSAGANDLVTGSAIDASGKLWITGYSTSTSLNLGGGALVGTSDAKPFVASFVAGNLVHASSRVFSATGGTYANAIAVHPNGASVIIAGTQYGEAVLVPGETGTSDGTARAFLAGLGPNP